jgi:hypothetical protein
MNRSFVLFYVLIMLIGTNQGWCQWSAPGGSYVYTTSGTVNVGIGTSAPPEKLTVVGGIAVRSENSSISIEDGTSNNARLGFVKKSGLDPEIVSGSGTAIIFAQSNQTGVNINIATATLTERMRIASGTGYVGIGTSSPLSSLHVAGNAIFDNATPYLYTGSLASDQNRYLHLGNSPSTGFVSGLKAGGVLIADTYTYANPGENDLVVKGKVGIGTALSSNPNNYMLAVNGVIGAKEIKIEDTSTAWQWPDYVFHNDYRLPPLLEVKRYIEINKHLMDVPSAEAVKQNGQSLGEMNAVLLKKIEELTLYIIQQEERLQALEERVGR